MWHCDGGGGGVTGANEITRTDYDRASWENDGCRICVTDAGRLSTKAAGLMKCEIK